MTEQIIRPDRLKGVPSASEAGLKDQLRRVLGYEGPAPNAAAETPVAETPADAFAPAVADPAPDAGTPALDAGTPAPDAAAPVVEESAATPDEGAALSPDAATPDKDKDVSPDAGTTPAPQPAQAAAMQPAHPVAESAVPARESAAVAPAAPVPTEAALPKPVIPLDFGLDDEHPMLAVPFALSLNGRRYEGQRLSVTHLLVQTGDDGAPAEDDAGIARLHLRFDGFDLTLQPAVKVIGVKSDGAVTLCFTDPTGPHLPQVRYVLNNVIAGSLSTLDGLMAYTGPTRPKPPKSAPGPTPMRQRVRSIVVASISVLLILCALVVLYGRYTTGREMFPVFLELAGQQMRATTAGQIGYVNPEAGQGEVVFAINANTGDVLNFVMPCDCEFAIADSLNEGTTVLPSDLILTIFNNTSEIRAQTMISVEGLARAMEGDNVYLDLNDGRSLPVEVIVSAATSEATMQGGVFVPVRLRAPEGALTDADVGKSGRLRITTNMLRRSGLQ